jgi:small-conductance mechanosensitive channel
VSEQEGTRFDYSHFANIGTASLDFETVYYVLSADYTRFLEIQHAIYFGLYEAFERDGIRFAYTH